MSEGNEARTVLAIPMLNEPPIIIEGQFPLRQSEWDYFMGVINALKPGLIVPPVSLRKAAQ